MHKGRFSLCTYFIKEINILNQLPTIGITILTIRKRIPMVGIFFPLIIWWFRKIFLSLQRLGGEIPSHRCISFYFALYRRRLRNFLWNSSNEEQGKSQRKAIPLNEHQLCTTHWRGSILISLRGVPFSEARPFGKVHKDGHAILYGL